MIEISVVERAILWQYHGENKLVLIRRS